MHEQQDEGKGERIRKKAFYIIAVVAIIAILLYSLTSNFPGIIKSPVSEQTVGAIPISAEFDSVPNLKFQKVSLDEIIISTTKDASAITVQGNALDVSGLETVEIIIRNYKGALSTQDGKISFKGTAENIYVNNVGLKNSNTPLSVSAIGADFTSLSIPNVHIETIEYTTTGDLSVGVKQVHLTLQDEPVIINGYTGSASIGSSFKIDGTSDSITTPDFKIAK